MKVIVHHSQDFDGYFSAVITALRLLRNEQVSNNSDTLLDWHDVTDWIKSNIIFFPYNYQEEKHHELIDEIDEREDNIDEVCFVDCMFKDAKTIETLTEAGILVTTLDHHESSFKWQEEFMKSKWPYANQLFNNCSINSSAEGEHLPISAVELCYDYDGLASCKYSSPLFVKYLSAYDVWNKYRFSWKDETLAFQYGLRSVKEIDLDDPMSFFKDDCQTIVTICSMLCKCVGVTVQSSEHSTKQIDSKICQDMIDKGRAILEFIASRNKSVAAFGRSIVLRIIGKDGEQKHEFDNCYMAADYCNNSLLFEDYLENIEDYDILVLAKPDVFDKEKLSMSLITSFWNNKHPAEVRSAGALCELLGGGGHQGIGGCKVYYDLSEDEKTKKTIVTIHPMKID